MANEILPELQKAVQGLLYMSETDAPFEVIEWARREPTLSAEELLTLVGKGPGTRVEEVSSDEFFADLTQDQDWHDADDEKTVARYRNLLAVLEKHLGAFKVFKVGQTKLDIYLVGRTPVGDWAGIKTAAVET